MLVPIIAVIILVLIGLELIKMEHLAKKFKLLLMIIIAFLFYFSIVGVMNSDKVDLSSPRGVINGIYIYFGWIGETASNLWDAGADSVRMVGNAIKIDDNEDDEK